MVETAPFPRAASETQNFRSHLQYLQLHQLCKNDENQHQDKRRILKAENSIQYWLLDEWEIKNILPQHMKCTLIQNSPYIAIKQMYVFNKNDSQTFFE